MNVGLAKRAAQREALPILVLGQEGLWGRLRASSRREYWEMEEPKMSEEAASVTLDVTSIANSQDPPTTLARAERAKLDGRFDSALELYLEAATSTELPPARSEERRVGKECRSRWS